MRVAIYIKDKTPGQVKVGGMIDWYRETGEWTYDVEVDSIGELLKRVQGEPLKYQRAEGVFEIEKIVTSKDNEFIEALSGYLKEQSEWVVKLTPTITKTKDILGEIKILKAGEPTDYTKKHGLVYNKPKRRWMRPKKDDSGKVKQPKSKKPSITEPIRTGKSPDSILEVADANFTMWALGGNENMMVSDLTGGVVSQDHNESKRVKELAKKIKQNRRFDRLIVDQDGNVLEGQHRLDAARLLGLPKVPVAKIIDLESIMPVDTMKDAVTRAGLHREQSRQIVTNIGEMAVAVGGLDEAKKGILGVDQGRWHRYYEAAFRSLEKPEIEISQDAEAVHKKAGIIYEKSPDRQNVSDNEGTYNFYNYRYGNVNKALREAIELAPDEQEIYEGMKDTMRPTRQDYIVWRGWRLNPGQARLEEGQVFASLQFTSTTLDSHYAVQWMSYNSTTGEVYKGNPLWRVTVPAGTKAIMPSGVSNDYERELTLDSGARFKCVYVQEGEQTIEYNGRTLYVDGIYDVEIISDE